MLSFTHITQVHSFTASVHVFHLTLLTTSTCSLSQFLDCRTCSLSLTELKNMLSHFLTVCSLLYVNLLTFSARVHTVPCSICPLDILFLAVFLSSFLQQLLEVQFKLVCAQSSKHFKGNSCCLCNFYLQHYFQISTLCLTICFCP